MSAEVEDETPKVGGGYHYFHDKVGSGAPPPEHVPVAVTAVEAAKVEDTAWSISKFAFMDDDDVVKVYIDLEGDLEGRTTEDVEFEVKNERYNPVSSMLLHIKGKQHLHRLYVSNLMNMVVPEECSFKILAKKQKLVIKLKKKTNDHWEDLRAKVCLPYRRGGGG